ncbi:MAG: Mov34/MPN/PAD-1 family protein [Verrucomicrobia bacterium]|nr:Mov34/MPN/PAD-1 family protein [Verrucomicrobiota bacterium]
MREVCFILIEDKIVRADVGSATSIPDLPDRWQTIWEHRNEITEIAHTHPGELLEFSKEDLTTMQAVEAGTDKRFTWSVITRTGFLSRKDGRDVHRADTPWWLGFIRRISYDE